MNEGQDPLLLELEAVRAEMQAARQIQRRTSKLDRYKGELLRLHKAGASTKELAHWLRTRQHVRVHPTTVLRRLTHWQHGQQRDAG